MYVTYFIPQKPTWGSIIGIFIHFFIEEESKTQRN